MVWPNNLRPLGAGFALVCLLAGCSRRPGNPESFQVRLQDQVPRPEQALIVPVFNPYEVPLRLVGFSASCHCGNAIFKEETIPPHGTSNVEIIVDTTAVAEMYTGPGQLVYLPKFSSPEGRQVLPGVPIEIEFDLKQLIHLEPKLVFMSARKRSAEFKAWYSAPIVSISANQQTGIEIRPVKIEREGLSTFELSLSDAAGEKPPSFIAVGGYDSEGILVSEARLVISVISEQAVSIRDNVVIGNEDRVFVNTAVLTHKSGEVASIQILSDEANCAISKIAFDAETGRLSFIAENNDQVENAVVPIKVSLMDTTSEICKLHVFFKKEQDLK